MNKQGLCLGGTARIARSALWTVVALVGVLASAGAMAQDDESAVATVEVRIWAFSSNPNFYAYSTKNHLDEEMLFVGQAGSPQPVYSEAATPERSPRDILLSRELRDSYGWNSEGVPGLTSPSGYWTLSVQESGPTLSVVVRHGSMVAPIGSVERILDPGGREYAGYEIKEARWSDNGRVVVVVVHHSLTGEWPLEVDTAHGFPAPTSPDSPPPAGE